MPHWRQLKQMLTPSVPRRWLSPGQTGQVGAVACDMLASDHENTAGSRLQAWWFMGFSFQ